MAMGYACEISIVLKQSLVLRLLKMRGEREVNLILSDGLN